jgi:AcrR family transcriptional regulator
MVAVMSSEEPMLRLSPGPQGVPRAEVARVQRERLMAAMAHVAGTIGYESTSVERVLVQAGVSRRTFYELFDDREDCFVATYEAAVQRALRTVTEAYAEAGAPERRIENALEAFLRLCAAEPDLARACVVEVFAAGTRARERRAEAMERLAALTERALGELRDDDELDRLSARALIGAVHELIYRPIDLCKTDELPGMARAIVETQVAPLLAVTR